MIPKNILKAIKAQPASSQIITDPEKIKSTYRYWRIRILYSLFIGYAIFYFVRKNLSASTPAIMEDLSLSKTDIGILWSILYFVYGLGKFGNGILGDKMNPRYLMAIGLIFSAIMNIFFGLSSSFVFLALFWGINGYFQAMGWPPCARGLTHWYSSKERGTYWGIWNASHQVGGAIILVLSGWLAANYGWRSSFFIPAVIAILTAVFLWNRLRDTPESLGLPSIEDFHNDPTGDPEAKSGSLATKEILWNHVLNNKYIWALAVGNFFVYIVRYGAMDWAPTFLVESKGTTIENAGFQVAGFELTGILGAFAAGFLSDKLFKGRRGPLNVIYMALLIFALFAFWKNPAGNGWLDAICLASIGFLVYGPQMLVGVSAADIASKHAAATATGFTGLAGYMGGIVAGVGAGSIVDKYGWDGGFKFFLGCAIVGSLCFATTWKQTAFHGKKQKT